MLDYNPKAIEPKWQQYWEEKQLARAEDFSSSPAYAKALAGKAKFYCLDMFPYPSGAGLHVGHPKGYTATDVISRYKRMNGFNVLHPMGWDAFGLPAENYAIKTKIHPDQSTHENILHFKEQIKSFGFSYDWTREIDTSSPDYYKWTQWFFLFLYKQGLAYKAKAPVNWCPKCQTVLANEQAQNGQCDRCQSQVEQKELEQWFFKITDFSEELLEGLDRIDWPEPIKTMQRNWIGKSEGINITYKIKGLNQEIVVFTTRPDTNFGATFIVLAPDCQFVQQNIDSFPRQPEVQEYVKISKEKTELERLAQGRKKTGVFTGLYAINNLNNKELPVYISDFVLATVGTGAVVGVPGHDLRDFEFAQEMGLEIIRVVVGKDGDTSPITEPEQVQEEEGAMINSGFLDGMDIHQATKEVMDYLEQKGWGKRTVSYRLRDWLVSRQRYWGAPIPIIYCEKCGEVPVLEADLPVLLATDVDFMPTGESPLAKSKDFHNVKCTKCGSKARRESDTMDTFVCSSWYFFRYTDPNNKKEFADKKLIHNWCPVDIYVGGAEHAVLHLLYARFFTKALFKAGLISFDEPFLKLRNVGLVLAEGGEKMSKSKGNVINPDEVIKEYGADTLRLYEMFMGPFEQAIAWDTKSIRGVRRFLDRVYNLKSKVKNQKSKIQVKNQKLEKLLHKTIKKVSEDIEQMKFNTAISALMILVNEMEKEEEITSTVFVDFLKLLAPFAPHLAEELYARVTNKKENEKKESVFEEEWPKHDISLTEDETVHIIAQINGKVRGAIACSRGLGNEQVLALTKASPQIAKWLENKKIKNIVFVPDKLINFVV